MIVGRDAELASIDAALRDGRRLLITGGRGTGRSALLAEAARRHASAGATVLVVGALPGDRGVPGAGLQRLLHPVRDEAPVGLAFLWGTAHGAGHDVGAAVDALAARLAARGPVLWCVDDLERLDELSRTAILRQRHATVLATGATGATWATGDAGDTGNAGGSRNGGATGDTVLRPYLMIELDRLSPADATALLAGMPGLAGHPGARLVLAQAAGNPLALTELARNLVSGPPITPATTELPVPDRLRRALAPTVDDLDPVRMRAALLAAFAAETPGPATAAALAVLVSPDVWQWLVADGVLRPGRRRRFTHPVVRAAVIDRAGHAQRRDARHQLAALLPAGGPARAWHTAHAEPVPGETLAGVLDAAGGELLAAGRLRAAGYALGLAARLSGDPARALARQRRAAYSAHLAGEQAWSRQLAPPGTGAGVPGDATAVIDVPEIAPLLLRAWLRGDEDAREAVRDLLGSGRPVAGPIVAVWASAIVEDTDPDGAAERMLHQRVRPSRRDPMSPEQRQMVLGTIALARHETVAAVRYMSRSVELVAHGSLHEPIAHCGLAGARYDLGELDAAADHAVRTLAALGVPADAGSAGGASGFSGAIGAAGGASGFSGAIGAAAGRAEGSGVHDDLRAGALAVLASVAVLREDADAEEWVRRARAGLRPADQAAHDLRLVRAQGLIAGMRGRHELAFRRLRRLHHPDGRPVHHRLSDLGLADLARVAVILGRDDEVRPLVEAATPRIRALRSVRASAIHHRALALLAGTSEQAETYFRLALADPASDVWAVERALTRMDYAAWLRRRQRPAESRPLLEAARDVFAAAGLTAWQERAEAELAAAGPPSRPGLLTPQQHQVVMLAAQGLTNPQIAARLGLSARTVGIHLSRAYPILGVTRRSQLPLVMQ
ncbi:putative LuxR-family transcriptional regulator [Actinoplanes missouriensis 431]|uniref:Putative LuxR-family transcriptional regulator n=1 Tax=Actinoplanes missouriensis (strain ATCC 14538 / DSM 43046 / CBS 188.64 / JCM 3121 / NBRC 102363 / NCIMB 12654 / NRRL B-3342 / UNCC 431) TaxID=512565 RepID=I0H9X4_ACTM4|nr:LuxR family transcriptional regulator [Actinoplanes missouriensis]BAL89811.1 putative LuxR-family transcriptional regulator [Actinoplanes missouriensis 431]